MADKLTIEQFAAYIKQRDPALQSVPDDVLVRNVLERRPEMLQFLQTSEPREPLGSWYERTGGRIKSNFDLPNQIRGIGDQVGEEIRRVKQQGLGPKSEFWKGGRLPEVWEALKKTYSDPANILGDVITAHMINAGEGGPEPIKMAAKGTIATELQRLSGAGREPVLIEEIRRERRIADRATRYERAKLEIEKKNQEILQEHANKVNEAQAKYQKELDEYNKSGAEKKVQYADKVSKARKEWVDRTAQYRSASNEANKIDSQKDTLTRSQTEYGDRLLKNLKSTYQTINDRLGSRWHKLRTTPIQRGGAPAILNDELGNAKAIQSGMETAENRFLHGSPGSIRQFRDLAGWIERGPEGSLKDPTWDELRTHYSSIGDAMYGRPVPPNVYRALNYMRNIVIGEQLNSMATKAGVGEDYTKLLKDNSQFESDWKDMHSVARAGGSPLAVALKAPNAASLIPQITGKTGDILIERLSKYTDAGASPTTAAAIRKLSNDINNLPKVRVPTSPGKFETPAEPKLGDPPELKLPELPGLRTAKPPEPVSPVDPVDVRRRRILQYTSRPKSFRDYMPPRVFAEPLLGNRFIREWVAKYPRREFPVPKSAAPSTPRIPPPIGPEPETEMLRRRGPGEPPPPSGPSIDQLRAQVDTLRARYAQERASADSGMFQTGSKLKDAMDALQKAELAQWGSQYQTSPQKLGSEGGGGANYTADQLAEFKKKWGIK